MRNKRSTLAAVVVAVFGLAVSQAQAARVIVVKKPRAVRVVKVSGPVRGYVDLNIKPKKTLVWVDGVLRGKVDQFDGYPRKLALSPGWHRLKLVTPDGEVLRQKVRVVAGHETDIRLDLRD